VSPAASYDIAVVCEGPADLRTATELADRLLIHEVDWIQPEILDQVRRWSGFEDGEPFLPWRRAPVLAKERGFKVHGKFSGHPDYSAARYALLLLALKRPHAVLLIRDTDGELARRESLEQVRDEVEPGLRVPILLGVAHTKRECWVLAGFEPQNDKEKRALDRLTRELGSDPRLNAESLSAAEPGALRNAKRVLEVLLAGRQDREPPCWLECDLKTLRERGRSTGLADYLEEVRTRLVPLFSGRPPDA
jgi:hypothetical protein